MTQLLEKELVYKIVGCAMNVHSGVGPGLREKTYERGLYIEFDLENLEFNQQAEFAVHYRGKKIDEFIPDLIVKNKVVVEIKTVESINDEHRGQLLNYLRITGIEVGLILNFKPAKLEWERLVLKTARK
ncbi:MAG: GxxExxY protein [Candidatus Marinimicrobia bacterium]|nr:GxxExxY protein [Candidatus Neomarinimicrobiota bacterium]